MALSTLGTVLRTLMALEPARATLGEALEKTSEKSWTGFADWSLAELCALHASAGDWDLAHDYATQTLQSRGDESLLPMGFAVWYETEALLRGGDEYLARAEVERLAQIVGDNQRFRIPLLRSRAVLARWDDDTPEAIQYLQSALALAREMSLPGEEWSILGVLAELYTEEGNRAKSHQAWEGAGVILLDLAESIDDEELRAGFLAAGAVRAILERREES